jgi:hypothetical protein
VVDLTPGNSNPYSGDPSQSGEEVILADSRGEQGSSGYNGHVTLAYLFGQPIVQVTTNPGESKDGPLQPLQDGLDQLCDASGDQVCLTLLGMHSSTSSNSSTNSFEAVGAHVGGRPESMPTCSPPTETSRMTAPVRRRTVTLRSPTPMSVR